jgi:hypothetical protein
MHIPRPAQAFPLDAGEDEQTETQTPHHPQQGQES